jgi:hypothetical protein
MIFIIQNHPALRAPLLKKGGEFAPIAHCTKRKTFYFKFTNPAVAYFRCKQLMVTTKLAQGVLPSFFKEGSAKPGVVCIVLKKVVSLHNTSALNLLFDLLSKFFLKMCHFLSTTKLIRSYSPPYQGGVPAGLGGFLYKQAK